MSPSTLRRLVLEPFYRRMRKQHGILIDADGFVRQILGWREFMRGVYWWRMPDLARASAPKHEPQQLLRRLRLRTGR